MKGIKKGFFLLWSTLSHFAIGQGCYYVNGTAVPPEVSQPCPNAPVTSICCALNRTNPPGGDKSNGLTRDECLPNGLCQNRVVDKGVLKTSYWLNFCTDKEITSTKCLDICREKRVRGGWTEMRPCDGTNTSTQWCCGSDTSCCTNSNGVVELPQEFIGRALSSTTSSSVSTSVSTTSSSISTSASTTSTSSPETGIKPGQTSNGTSSTNLASNSSNNKISAGAGAGIGVGVALGVMGAVFFIYKALGWRKQAQKAAAQDNAADYHGSEGHVPDKYRTTAGGNEISEMPLWEGVTRELPTTSQRVELSGTGTVSELK